MILVASTKYAYTVLIIATVITFAIRASSFVLFGNKDLPKPIKYISNVLPFAIIPTLVIYCIRDTQWLKLNSVVPVIVGIALTAIIHYWRKNVILSIIVGTVAYMVLIRIL